MISREEFLNLKVGDCVEFNWGGMKVPFDFPIIKNGEIYKIIKVEPCYICWYASDCRKILLNHPEQDLPISLCYRGVTKFPFERVIKNKIDEIFDDLLDTIIS
jgi:hypothetical protein